MTRFEELRIHPMPRTPHGTLLFPAALLLAQFRPVFQALGDLAFETRIFRLVVGVPRHSVGKIVLAGEPVLGSVVVFVALAVTSVSSASWAR